MAHPALDQVDVERQPDLALLFDDLDGGVDQVRLALVEHEQDRQLAGLVVAVGLGGVVQTQHRGGRPPSQDPAADLEPVGEGLEADGEAPLVGRGGVHAQAGPGDDPERALAADEQLVEIGSRRLPGVAAGGDHGAVGQHDVEADDHVLDLAVAGRELAGAATGQPAADGREGDRLRPVPAREAVGGAQLVFEVVAEGAGPHVDGERRVVDVDDAGQVAEIEDDAAVERDRRAAHPAAPGRGGDGDAGLVADAEDGRDLVGRVGTRHGGRQAGDLAVERPRHGQGPPVAAGFGGGRRGRW